MIQRRALLLHVSAAMWGVAIAISLIPIWSRPAPPGQPPGLATTLNLDDSAPMRFILGLMLLPILVPLVLRPVLRRLDAGRAWATRGAAGGMVTALWMALIDQDIGWTVIPTAIALLACTLLRNFDARFSRRDIILIPTALTVFLALMDLVPGKPSPHLFLVAAMLTLAIRLAVINPLPRERVALSEAKGRVRGVVPAFAFLLAPLGLVFQTAFFSYDQRHLGWPSLLIAVITPFVVRPLLRNERRAAQLLTWVIYPIVVYSYMSATSVSSAEGKPRVNFFEEAHGLLPASEMLRGERPYRDILPAHGLIEDGLLDYVTIRLRGDELGTVLKGRGVAGALNSFALYAVGVAATGVAEAGVLAFLVGTTFAILSHSFRFFPSLVTLALIAAAVRLRRPRLLGYAGAAAAASVLTSIDFGAYAIIVLAVAILRFGSQRLRALRDAAIGVAAVTIPLLLTLMALGIAGAFFRSTLFEIPSFAPAYAMNVFALPPIFDKFRFFPELIAAIFDQTGVLYLLWFAAAIVVAVLVTRRAERRTEPLLVVALFVTVMAISFAERHHLHFQSALAPLLIAAVWLLFRRRSPFAAAAVLVLMMMARITTHLLVLSTVRHAHGPLDDGWVEIADIPRARGALFRQSDAAVVTATKHFIDQNLGNGDTFVDFTNRGTLYFLFDRDCPIRQYEVAFYQPEERQREVIAAIERNPRVRAALMPPRMEDNTGVDLVPNSVRAPLVWAYLLQHFQPAFEEGTVVFWTRK